MVGLSVQDYTQSPGMQVASGCLLTDSDELQFAVNVSDSSA